MIFWNIRILRMCGNMAKHFFRFLNNLPRCHLRHQPSEVTPPASTFRGVTSSINLTAKNKKAQT